MDLRIVALVIAMLLAVITDVLAEGRPAGCPKLWCGCYARTLANSDPGPQGNLALNWSRFGRPARAGCTGCFAVMHRKGGGHVGVVTGYDPNGNPIIRSGNHNKRVGEGVYSRKRVVAWRWV